VGYLFGGNWHFLPPTLDSRYQETMMVVFDAAGLAAPSPETTCHKFKDR